MKKYNENTDPMLAAVYAMTMGIADQFRSSRFCSRFAEETLFLSYDLLREKEQARLNQQVERELRKIRFSGPVNDLRCEIGYCRGEDGTAYVTFRTGIEDYGLKMETDGTSRFCRIKAA